MALPLPWKPRDTYASLALALGTAAFVLWQNMHVAVLWDLAYLLDSSWRFALALHGGPIPYRDLPFAHPPLTFFVQGIIIQLFGRVYWHHVLYAALAGAVASLLTWRIMVRIMPHRWEIATLLAAPLIPLGVYSIYPHPIYDSDCILSVLLALYLLLRADAISARPDTGPYLLNANNTPIRGLRSGLTVENILIPGIAGLSCVVPLFYKQNIGLLFVFSALACVVGMIYMRSRYKQTIVPQLAILTGAVLALAIFLVALHFTVGIGNYKYWTLTFAAQRRLPGLSTLLGVYAQPSLYVTVPLSLGGAFLLSKFPFSRWVRIGAIAAFTAPFLYAAMTFRLSDDPADEADALLSLWPHLLLLFILFALWRVRRQPTFIAMLPLILLAAIHGSFLSQQLWGSTYALWPLLILLVALVLRQLPPLALPMALIITVIFVVCGTRYALSWERLSYNHTDGQDARATLHSLSGLTTPGPYIPAFEELVHATDELIPAGDGVLLIPGQEPFYYATGRKPQFPVLLIDPATNPYSPTELREEARRRNIQWLIVNRTLQLTAEPVSNLPEYIQALSTDFAPAQILSGYTIYHRQPQDSFPEAGGPETASPGGPS